MLGSILTAKHRLKEINAQHKNELDKLRIAYGQKLDENILRNARQYKEQVYFPLNQYLKKLAEEYDNFQIFFPGKDVLENKQYHKSEREEFQKACNEFIKQISDLNDALLISELADRLNSFTQFIKASIYYEEPTQPRRTSKDSSVQKESTVVKASTGKGRPVLRRIYQKSHIDLDPLTIMRAPIYSLEFNKRFLKDIKDLNNLIRYVTTGEGNNLKQRW